jgi:hypothetical protein
MTRSTTATTKNNRTTTSTSPALQSGENGATKLTNHSNNLLIISSYNGSLTKVSYLFLYYLEKEV